ncbi:MAG: SH3 domain-containing protein [Bacillus sp. (in: Bacteria)]|nr:SH3 domain-containing protein [Bacillus sp. (in: firmicutes)]
MNKYAAIATIILLIASIFFKVNQDSITYANANDVGEITASSLNVREQASTNSRIIGSLSRGARVELHEKQGSWYKVRVNNRWGFIHGDFVRIVSSGSSSGSFQVIASGQVTASSLNIRSTASTSGRIIGSFSRGTNVQLYEKVGQWYRVKVNNGWGFVHGDFLTVKNQSGSSSGSSNLSVIGKAK